MKRKILSVLIIILCIGTFSLSAYASSYEIADMRRYVVHSSSSSSSNDLSGVWTLLVIFIAVGGYYFIKYQYQKAKDDNAGERLIRERDKQISQINSNNFGEPQNLTEKIANEIRKNDKNFSGDKFIWFAENYFIAYKDAYSDRNIKLVEELTTEDIFFDDKKALEDDIEHGIAHICERVNFQTDYLYRYEYNDKFEYISMYIKARMVEYVKGMATGDSLRGSKNTDSFNFYSITLRRKLGEKTIAIIDKGVTSFQCPNCGSNVDAVIAGKCKYCGKTVKTTDSSWKISAIRKTETGTDLGMSGIFRIT